MINPKLTRSKLAQTAPTLSQVQEPVNKVKCLTITVTDDVLIGILRPVLISFSP